MPIGEHGRGRGRKRRACEDGTHGWGNGRLGRIRQHRYVGRRMGRCGKWRANRRGGAGGAFGAMEGLIRPTACFVAGTEAVVEVEYEDEDGNIRRISGKKLAKRIRREGRNSVLATMPKILRYITRPIETLRRGDWIITRDENDQDGALLAVRIKEVHKRVTLSPARCSRCARRPRSSRQSRQPTSIPSMCRDRAGFRRRRKWTEGDLFHEMAGESTVIATRHEKHLEGVEVYNLTLEEGHTYFVREQDSTMRAGLGA